MPTRGLDPCCSRVTVLSDELFVDMDAEIINNAPKTKVDGIQYFHNVFENGYLDFFILSSPLGSIVGNLGQSTYHAVNLFMAGLAVRRRDQGFSVSLIHVGVVTGVG